MLIERGEVVRYITRSGPPPGLAGLPVEPVQTDLFDVEALTNAFDGATVVYHSAARISIMSGDEAELHRVNVEGTRNALIAARAAGVSRFVHVGSIEAFPLEDGPFPISEAAGFNPDQTVMEYGRSKALSMQLALAAAGDGMDCVVCCPTAFIGPPDYRRSPMGQVILDLLCGRLPASVGGGFDFVDVRDVALGLIRASEAGRNGRVYLLSGRYETVPSLIDMIAAAAGVRKPPLRLPTRLLLPIMPIVETYYRISGRPPRFTKNSLKILSLGVRVDSSRAATELGYATRPLEETLADTVEWFARHGYLEASGGVD